MKKYYIKIYLNNIIGSPILLEETDSLIVLDNMLECENYESFHSCYNIIKYKEIINNKVVFTFEDIPETTIIQNLKNKKLKLISNSFNEAFSLGCITTFGFKVNCKYRDITNLQILLRQTDINETINFRDYNNIFHAISYNDLNKICNEIDNYILGLYQKKWNLKEVIKNTITIEELELITW